MWPKSLLWQIFQRYLLSTASFSKACRANIYLACEASGCETRFPHYADYTVTTVTNRRAGTILKPPSDSKHTLYIPRSDRWADLRDRRQGRGRASRNSVWSIILHPGRFSTVSFMAGIRRDRWKSLRKDISNAAKIMQNAKQTQTKYRESHRLIHSVSDSSHLPGRVCTS